MGITPHQLSISVRIVSDIGQTLCQTAHILHDIGSITLSHLSYFLLQDLQRTFQAVASVHSALSRFPQTKKRASSVVTAAIKTVHQMRLGMHIPLLIGWYFARNLFTLAGGSATSESSEDMAPLPLEDESDSSDASL